MKGYSILRTVGVLYLLAGLLGIAGGVLLMVFGVVQFLQPYSVSSGLEPGQFRALAFGTLWNGFLLLLAALFAIAFSQLIDLLFELRARLAGTYVEPTPRAKPAPSTATQA